MSRLTHRPRRLRRGAPIRSMVQEHHLRVEDFVAPLFVKEGSGLREAIDSMPGQFRLSVDELQKECRELQGLGIRAVALFPAVEDSLKDPGASQALDPDGLYARAIRAVKEVCPNLLVITDAALDPYSSDGHDGLVIDGVIDNDATLPMLARMAVLQADSGADLIAPSDMMDGRVGVIREALDAAGHVEVGILSYTAKYASSFYGPFREALDSAPRELEDVPADKKTYQMNPANVREALREAALDLEEGADMLMVKPGMPYLDVVRALRDSFPDFPLAVYNVSGEYAMIKAAAERGWLDEKPVVLEVLTAFKRAGADIILTYHAKDAAKWLQST
ncbi:MAG: porphobilinogen synthase [Rhodothermales bacterium]|jgi:porphobilinogen synthase